MIDTPITDKAWDEIPHYVMSFGRAIRMRDACRVMERQRNKLLRALEYLLESTERPPDPNCSCHIRPPCSDCVDYSGLREAVAIAEEALAQAEGEKP